MTGSTDGESKLESPLLGLHASTTGASSPGPGSGHGEAVSGQLESIRSDESLPRGRRVLAASVVEMRLLVRLAAPAVLVYMINYLMSMSTQIFSGHLRTLAAAALGNTGIQGFTYGPMLACNLGLLGVPTA